VRFEDNSHETVPEIAYLHKEMLVATSWLQYNFTGEKKAAARP